MAGSQPDDDEARFAPPPEPDIRLELEPRAPAPAPPPQVRPRRFGRHAGVVVALLVVALVALGVAVIARHGTDPLHRTLPIGDGAISIQVVGPVGALITIDGKRVGKAPLILHMRATTRLLLIEAPGVPPKQVPGDRDQRINLLER